VGHLWASTGMAKLMSVLMLLSNRSSRTTDARGPVG
jgi:hypothetical protein